MTDWQHELLPIDAGKLHERIKGLIDDGWEIVQIVPTDYRLKGGEMSLAWAFAVVRRPKSPEGVEIK